MLQIYPANWAPAEDYNGTYSDDEVTAMHSAFMNPSVEFKVPGTIEFCAACSTVQLKSVPNSAAMLAARENFNRAVARFDDDSEEAALCASDYQVGSQLDIGSEALAKVDALPALCHATGSEAMLRRRKLQMERERAARMAEEAAEEVAEEAREVITMGTHRELGVTWKDTCKKKLGWKKYQTPTCTQSSTRAREKCCKKWERCSFRACITGGGPDGLMNKRQCKDKKASNTRKCNKKYTTNPFVTDADAIDDVRPAMPSDDLSSCPRPLCSHPSSSPSLTLVHDVMRRRLNHRRRKGSSPSSPPPLPCPGSLQSIRPLLSLPLVRQPRTRFERWLTQRSRQRRVASAALSSRRPAMDASVRAYQSHRHDLPLPLPSARASQLALRRALASLSHPRPGCHVGGRSSTPTLRRLAGLPQVCKKCSGTAVASYSPRSPFPVLQER